MGLLDNALQALKSQYEETKGNVGLLVSDPKRYMSGLNQDAAEYNRLSSLALQAERNAYRGIPVSQEQAAAKQYIDQQQQDMALGFTGSIKPVKPVSGLIQQSSPIVREGNPIQSAVVLIGDKIFTGRTHSDALQRAIYEGAIRKESGKLIFPKDVEINSDLFMTKDGRIIDRLQAYKMFDVGSSEQAIESGLMQNKPSNSMNVDAYMKEAKKIKNSMTPER